MSFDLLKTQSGQYTSTIAIINLDQCRHTVAQSVIDGAVVSAGGIDSVFTGNITISGGLATSFINSNPYILWDNEIIKITVVDDFTLTITARSQFGTVAVSHLLGDIKIMHSGEADGSCLLFPHTCSSPDSYDENITYPFVFPDSTLKSDILTYNGFSKWSHNPAVVDPGQSIGKRAGGSLTLLDSKDTDVYVPYHDRRSLNGTLFTKALARHPNWEGRSLTILSGFDPLNFDEINYIKRKYIIDSVSLNKSVLNVKFLDPLILTEGKKSKAPKASRGNLSTAITNASTSLTYKDAPAFDYGVTSSTGLIRIDREVIAYTVASDFVLTINARNQWGTEKKDHNLNATVQLCLHYDDVNVVTIIEDLLTNYTEIKPTFFDDYSTVIADTASITLTALITKPTPVVDLNNELVKNGDLIQYYKEETQKIVISQVKDLAAVDIEINEDDHIKADSISTSRDVKTQYTRYTVAWAVNDATQIRDDEDFSIVYQSINLNKELPENKGETNEKKTFYNRWLTDSNSNVLLGTSIAQRLIDRSDDIPELIDYTLDVESVFTTQNSSLELGTVYNLSTSRFTNFDGSNKSTLHQILSMKDLGNMQYRIKSRLFQDPLDGVNVDFTISTNKEDYDLSTEFAPAAGNYNIFIEQGVVIGSTATNIFAFTTGTQAAGVTFTIIIRGSILGHGGGGGDGAALIMPIKEDIPGSFENLGDIGFIGGNAFEATVDVVINNGSGAIWAGGGGGAGGKSVGTNNVVPIFAVGGNGGCGGQGYGVAFGGVAGFVILDGSGVIDTGSTGINGSVNAAGTQGINFGGDWGESGSDEAGILGGITGYAITSNGNSVTFSSGDNAINIKGRRQ